MVKRGTEADPEEKSEDGQKGTNNADGKMNGDSKKMKGSSKKMKGNSKKMKNDNPKIKEEKKGKYEKPLGKKFDKQNSSQTAELEKPNWVDIKKKQKELKQKYKVKKLNNIYDISVQAKKIGEKLRRTDCQPEERKKLALSAHDLLKTHYNKVVLTHDMSRIVQWIIKYSDTTIRQAVLNELKPSLVSMIGSKYAKNCVRNMLKYGSSESRRDIISSCYGNVVKFISHSVSAPLLELMYATWATETEKIYFKQEFYGDMYKQAKDKNIKDLSDIFNIAGDMKTATLSAVKGNLMRILNKKLINFTLVQNVVFEFLNHCSVEDRSEIIVMLREAIVELSQTKTGTKIATLCVWHGSNKDRKFLLKALKENVKTVAMSEHGYLILLALFDSIDDTVLVKKIILSEILNDVTDIALNEYGKHVILYLVARRNSHYFPPSIVKYLEQGDNNAFSKKPADVRAKELLDSIIESLLETVKTNIVSWMSNSSIAMVTLAILKVGTGAKLKDAFESIARFITDVNATITEGEEEHKPVEHAGLHMMLKKLIQNDKELLTKDQSTFGEVLIDCLTKDVIEYWIECNRGCFLLVLLLENETQSVLDALISKLKPINNILKSKSNPGAKILLKKLR